MFEHEAYWKVHYVKSKKTKLCDLLLTEYYDVVSKQQSEEENKRYNSLQRVCIMYVVRFVDL